MDLQEKKQILERFAHGREDDLIERYIADGPTELKEKLGFADAAWRVVFDYLVFEHNLLYKTVMNSADFFVDSYIKHGMTHVRDILDVNDLRYDLMWDLVFDFVAISREGLYYHVLENRDKYLVAFRARGGDFVRKVLGVWKEKYEENWLKVLDFLLNAACDGIFSEQTFEHGLRSFSYMINGSRDHRPIWKSERFRPGLG